MAVKLGHPVQYQQSLLHDLRADAVATDNGDIMSHYITPPSKKQVIHRIL